MFFLFPNAEKKGGGFLFSQTWEKRIIFLFSMEEEKVYILRIYTPFPARFTRSPMGGVSCDSLRTTTSSPATDKKEFFPKKGM